MSAEFDFVINTPAWTNDRHVVRCVKVIYETADVKTFCFTADKPTLFFFKPGQFVTVELEIGGETVMRSYTISSSPSVPYSFSISVKRLPGGKVSGWLHDNLQAGDSLVVHGPVGEFNCIDHAADKALLLSGGIGITPVMSMARWWFDTNALTDMKFIHSARTPKDIVYRRELEHMDSRIPNFDLSIVCEKYETGETWCGFTGFLNRPMLDLIAPDFMDREIFCCGPTPYMKAIKHLLTEAGYDMSRYHEESFGVTPEGALDAALEQAQQWEEEATEVTVENGFWVEFRRSGKKVCIAPGDTVSMAAANVGLHIPKACGMGICGTCKVLMLEGNVTMSHNGGITDSDKEEGYILSCCSVPDGDVAIEF